MVFAIGSALSRLFIGAGEASRAGSVYREGLPQRGSRGGRPRCGRGRRTRQGIPDVSAAQGRNAAESLIPHGLDLLFQFVEPDGAHHHLVADHVGRRAADAERIGELHVLVDRRLHLVAVHVLLEAGHIETDLLGDGERARLVGRAAAAEELLVKLDVFLSASGPACARQPRRERPRPSRGREPEIP